MQTPRMSNAHMASNTSLRLDVDVPFYDSDKKDIVILPGSPAPASAQKQQKQRPRVSLDKAAGGQASASSSTGVAPQLAPPAPVVPDDDPDRIDVLPEVIDEPVDAAPPIFRPPSRPASAGSEEAHASNASTLTDTPHGPMPVPAGPVFDAADGHLNLGNLGVTLSGLVHQLPALPDTATPAQRQLRNRLRAQLAQMRQLAEIEAAQPGDQRMPPHELGLRMRHGCKQASRTAAHLAESLVSTQPTLGLEYLLLAGVYKEMKREHLSGAAQHIVEDYAKRQTAHLNTKCPGIGDQRAGATITSSKGLGLSWGPNTPLDMLSFNVGGAMYRESNYFVDEQNSVFGQNFLRFHGEGNLRGNLGKWVAKARFRAGTNYLGNDSIGTRMVGGPSLKDVVKLYNAAEADKAMMKTAGPKTQAWRTSYQKARNALTTTVLGRSYAKAPGAPTYLSRSKLAKGFNTTKLELLVQAADQVRLDRTHAAGQLGTLMRAAYPSMHAAIRDSVQNGQPLPRRGIHNVIPTEAFYGYASDPFVTAEVSAGHTDGEQNLEKRGVGISVGIGVDTLLFPNWLPQLPHQTLGFDFAKDPAETMLAHARLDNLVRGNTNAPRPPELHLYAAVAHQLGNQTDLRIHADPTMSAEDRAYYRGPDDRLVPRQFIDAINNPGIDKLTRAAEVASALGQLRLDFVAHAHAVLARPEASWPKAMKRNLHAQRRAAFEAVNEQVWGGRFPGGEKAALEHPEKFVAKSHGALSLAFGVAGTHLSIQKRQMQARGMTDATHAAAVRRADAAYLAARQVFDHDNLTMPQQKLGEGNSGAFNIYQMFRKHTASVTTTVSGGWEANTLDAATQAAGGRTQSIPVPGIPQSPPDPLRIQEGVSVAGTSRLGYASFSVRGRYQKLDLQDSPGRQGDYLEFTFTGTGGGPLGPVLQDAAAKVMKKMDLKQHPDATSVVTGALRQAHGMALYLEDGSKVTVRLRRAPGNPSYDLEYVRALNVSQHGFFPSVEVRTATDVFTALPAVGDYIEMPGHEFRGPDLYYLIAQHSKLRSKLDGDDVKGSVRKLLDRHPDMLAAYCGIGDTVPTVIDRYLDAMRHTDDAPTPRNEFHRFFKDPKFGRLAQIANDVASHAPGTRAGAADPFAVPEPLSNPVPMPAGMDWAQVKAEIAALPTLQARKDYYSRGNGRKVFETFVRILDKTHAVDAAASMHHDPTRTYGFHAMLSPKLAEHHKRVASGGEAGAVDKLKSLFAKPAPARTTAFGTLAAVGPLGTLFARQGGCGVGRPPVAGDPS